VSRLVVVADGALHRVPWDVLRLSDGRHVAERFAVSVAPSAAVLVTLSGRARAPRAGATARVLAFGDPAFAGERDVRGAGAGAAGAAGIYRSAFEATGGLPRLVASAEEARLVARYGGVASEVRLRERASSAYLKRAALDSFTVVHFATHALVDERSVARTALALAPGDGESGFVGVGDLAALRLDADLVVLSACRSAGGRVVTGEGVQGLTAPLLEAGARSVVATRWRIGDRSTVALVRDFYGAMARGLAVTDALQAAKLAAIGRGAPASEWAAFTAVGDPFVVIPLDEQKQPRGRWQRWLAATGAIVVAGALLAAAARRRRRVVR
jgi:CHAT domain-containing protein